MLTRPRPERRTYTTGRAPRGAHVFPFGGLTPARIRRRSRGRRPGPRRWFYLRPHLALPHLDGLLVPLDRPPHRHLRRPPMPTHQPPHPLDGVPEVEQPTDQHLDP